MSFLKFNKKLSLSFERALGYFPDRSKILENIQLKGDVADIGGGKQPYLTQRPPEITYTGIDIDPDELERAPPGIYTQTIVADITQPPLDMKFDVILCRYTLEHVTDTNAALRGLYEMMKPDAVCYISAPSRHAIFSHINKILPERFKKRILVKLYPSKHTDGFKAYYDKMSPSEMAELIKSQGGVVEQIHRVKFSGYFTFFFPLHLLWRMVSFVQMLILRDYCERFEIVFRKN
ncbi:bifunctional 3-demethylubiquinone-9 3-methyltransferase/ 2-octaprenyl-6-hydroxy phenol methylase [Roseovarius albus]|uniref:Bifunctional 3-demethylubiquinone-9 3-methyltransferase/ 2-octaprenyl-6-hydroxy phenol methylase n=1 Tax=Roseovarius albus TaxID=1247867 RepID=A0A1X6ZR69_9RHOB|nr:class I SAM-dependent methyltransferase [Roseovarius albus]SLN59097.1 bifunctional 3-demethylubiquinone-9 3-methyltransferase/ 2-octaprenyl-6-hydroxy phenol methylase [Roseovarius albus]